MKPEWTMMVDPVPQIKEVLQDLKTEHPYSVLSRWPRREDRGTLITVTEITNRQSESTPVVDQLGIQIDIWSPERDTLRDLTPLVNAAVCGIGYRRDYAGPEELLQGGGWNYRKTFRFGRRVDKRFMRLID